MTLALPLCRMLSNMIDTPGYDSFPAGLEGPLLTVRPRPVTRRSFGTGLLIALVTARLPAQKKPERIVSTAPSITETLFALGLGSQVVGVSQFCDFPPEVRKLPKVGTYLRPDPEAIARLTPDLVILEKNSNELTDRLHALHISFVEVPHETLNDVFSTIEIIGKAAGISERSMKLTSEIKCSLDAIRAKARALPSPRVLIIVDRRQGTLSNLIAVGPDNYENQLLTIAGGSNVLAKADVPEYPRISLETVIRENPDFIIDLSSSQRSEEENPSAGAAILSLWNQQTELAAVRDRHVYAGTSNALVVPGPRAAKAVQQLFSYIHSGETFTGARY